MKREQFTFYRSYYEALRTLPKKEIPGIILAICAYALDEEMPSLTGTALSVFTLIRPTLDTGRNKAANRKNKTEQAGNKSGTNEEQTKNKPEQNRKEKEREKEREVECEIENDSLDIKGALPPKPPAAVRRFTPPTVSEVQAYCRERGNDVNAQKFCDFYASKGWRVGNAPMKDWKACVRTWEGRDSGNVTPRNIPQANRDVMQRHQYTDEQFKAMVVDLDEE